MFKTLFSRKKPKATPDPAAALDPAPRLSAEQVFAHGRVSMGAEYIARPQVEEDVLRNLRDANKLIYFTGPTKSGKSVLIDRLSSRMNMAVIEAHTSMDEDEFWEQLRLTLEVPLRQETHSERQTTRGSAALGVEIGVSDRVSDWLGLKGRLVYRNSQPIPDTEVEARRAIQETTGRAGVINYLRKVPHTIVIDDFHWLSPDAYRGILSPFKGLLGHGVHLVLISVSKTIPDVSGEINDIAGRMRVLDLPVWTNEELAEIGETGFKRLNLVPDGRLINYLAIHSYGNPMLMQAICREYCRHHGIAERQDAPLPMPQMAHDEIGSLISAYARGETHHFDPLIARAEAGRWQTREATPRQIPMRWVFLLSISHLKVFTPISIDDMAERVRKRILVADTAPENLNALLVQQAIGLQKEMAGDKTERAPIYFDARAGTVSIVDPYFKQWLRWVRSADLAGGIFEK